MKTPQNRVNAAFWAGQLVEPNKVLLKCHFEPIQGQMFNINEPSIGKIQAFCEIASGSAHYTVGNAIKYIADGLKRSKFTVHLRGISEYWVYRGGTFLGVIRETFRD